MSFQDLEADTCTCRNCKPEKKWRPKDPIYRPVDVPAPDYDLIDSGERCQWIWDLHR